MSETNQPIPRLSRVIYLLFTALFLTGVIFQVYLAGMAVVARKLSWVNHITLGHALGLPLLVMLVSAYLGSVPRRTKVLTWLLFATYVLQADVVIFLRSSAPLISAVHPVLALFDFALAITLVREAWSLVKESSSTQAVHSLMQTTSAD
jgi:hypothetical protein